MASIGILNFSWFSPEKPSYQCYDESGVGKSEKEHTNSARRNLIFLMHAIRIYLVFHPRRYVAFVT